MVNTGRALILVAGFLQLLLFSISASGADIVVRSDRNPVGLNESFQLIYEAEGDVDDDPDFSVLEKQVDILNRSQSSNISIINGSYSSKKNWTLNVMAKQPGKLLLPPVPFGSDNSPSYEVMVNKATTTDSNKKDFFTRIRVNKSKIYVQQQLVVTQQLFSAYNLAAYGMGDLKFGGLDVVVEPLGDEKQYKTRMDGQAYVVVEKQFAVFPQQSGKLELEPILAEAQTGSRSNSIFNQFARGKVVRARSDAIQVEVMDMPADANMSPWLPASDLALLEQWADNSPKFVQGEPLTRTLSIKAEGLSAAQLPVLPDIAIDGFKQYPDQPLLENIRNDSGLSGYRVEKVAFIPTRSGKITLPAIEIPWWNTRTNQREVARIPSREVEVVPSPVAQKATPAAAAPIAETPIQSAPVPASESSAEPVPEVNADNNQLWMWVAVISSLGWLATALSWFLFGSAKQTGKQIADEQSHSQQTALFKALLASCQQGNASDCRAQILKWAKHYFSQNGIVSLRDLRTLLPASVVEQLTLLDAVLYGGSEKAVDFAALAEGLKQFVKTDGGKPAQQAELLQPLYK